MHGRLPLPVLREMAKRGGSHESPRNEENPEIKAWKELGQRFLEESKIDSLDRLQLETSGPYLTASQQHLP